jgi:Na+/melibiose symporter-like transporter
MSNRTKLKMKYYWKMLCHIFGEHSLVFFILFAWTCLEVLYWFITGETYFPLGPVLSFAGYFSANYFELYSRHYRNMYGCSNYFVEQEEQKDND